MSTIGPGGLNPMSSQFTAKAVRVASQQAGTVRSKKETEPNKNDQSQQLTRDKVSISQQGEGFDALRESNEASLTGTSQQLKKQQKEDEDSSEINMFEGEREAQQKMNDGKTEYGDHGQGMVDEVGLEEKLDALEVMNQSPNEVLKDVPEEYATAAKKIVEGQIQKGQPADSLKNLKEVPDTAPIEVQPERYHDIMPIHDTNNKPITLDMQSEANVS